MTDEAKKFVFGEWYPIETAPMDGTEVLVCDQFGVCAAAYDAEVTLEDFLEDVAEEGETEEDYKAFLEEFPALGWVSYEAPLGDQCQLEPTHWMPMPDVFPGAVGGQRFTASRSLSKYAADGEQD